MINTTSRAIRTEPRWQPKAKACTGYLLHDKLELDMSAKRVMSVPYQLSQTAILWMVTGVDCSRQFLGPSLAFLPINVVVTESEKNTSIKSLLLFARSLGYNLFDVGDDRLTSTNAQVTKLATMRLTAVEGDGWHEESPLNALDRLIYKGLHGSYVGPMWSRDVLYRC